MEAAIELGQVASRTAEVPDGLSIAGSRARLAAAIELVDVPLPETAKLVEDDPGAYFIQQQLPAATKELREESSRLWDS